ncbi:MAG: DUF6690 family protein [Thermoguttaceae bacterium]|jgi:hypothetical protein
MIKKLLWSAMGLAAAVALPVAYFSAPDYWKGGQHPAKSPAGAPAAAGPEASSASGTPPADGALLEPAPNQNLDELLRFDLTPDWIVHRFPRVSAGLGNLQLQGYRVPLVTGTAESDLAGALTYYFNAQQQLQRITFSGTTGDARRLIGLLSAQFHLTRRLTNDPGLMVYEAVRPGNQPASALRIRSAAVLKASEPRRRFDIELVLERPDQ